MYLDEFKQQLPDADPQETAEWLEALEQVVNQAGRERAQFLLRKLLKKSRLMRVGLPELVQTPYINTISPEQEPPFPGDEGNGAAHSAYCAMECRGDGGAGQSLLSRYRRTS
jgi:pyruvate dehydrogenase E1 component